MTNDGEAVVSLPLSPVFLEARRHLGCFSHAIKQWSAPLPLAEWAFISKDLWQKELERISCIVLEHEIKTGKAVKKDSRPLDYKMTPRQTKQLKSSGVGEEIETSFIRKVKVRRKQVLFLKTALH